MATTLKNYTRPFTTLQTHSKAQHRQRFARKHECLVSCGIFVDFTSTLCIICGFIMTDCGLTARGVLGYYCQRAILCCGMWRSWLWGKDAGCGGIKRIAQTWLCFGFWGSFGSNTLWLEAGKYRIQRLSLSRLSKTHSLSITFARYTIVVKIKCFPLQSQVSHIYGFA